VVSTVVVLVAFIGYALWFVFGQPEGSFASLAILILVGLAAFVGIMNFLSFSAYCIGIGDPRQPFGLPDGTVRAILTIAFIVLVGVLASFLLTHSDNRPPYVKEAIVFKGLPAADAQALQQRLSAEGLAVIVPASAAAGNEPARSDVQFFARSDYRLADDVAKQILTILSTILAAMIGFYFGARPGDGARTDEANERSRILAEINGLLAREPTLASLRAAADAKLASSDATHRPQVEKIRAALAEIESRIETVHKTTNDPAVPIEQVRAARSDARAAVEGLKELSRELARVRAR
jgi:hypothetical protein